jgi:hypothetical protein
VALWKSAAPADAIDWLTSRGWRGRVFDARERGAAANPVTITVIATPSDGSSPVVSRGSGNHDTTTSLTLGGASGTTWTLNWVTTFDFGVHPCASAEPGYSPFTVTVS